MPVTKKTKKVKKVKKPAIPKIKDLDEPIKPFTPKQTPPAEPIKPVEVIKSIYKVAPGKSITSKKGILGPGEEVKTEYMSGGQKTIDDRIKSGHIIKGS